ncbi:hypothetical protein BU24DRAFT_467369 [Aaosphaeria arxii CBS 175.79]|uniref:Uncharacterized protein n=1 Tax=Aaosphaeria arxii CBS 175.79 TaxID=1450172 RepID=A0A6A5XAI5_9PLEO|nr:uncharacterized protein BU24DRAFT_467369 [Aaosphaeria arxii CBS 175.79]KAF2009866.1 hypothetical protein BU24DRAFT_467369 [Aaosphaeria arxii CBS 175.79]
MPRPANNANVAAGKSTRMFSLDMVAALLMSCSVTTLTHKQYELMSALDGQKTVSALQHDFRAVMAKAKELKERIDGGEEFVPVAAKKRPASSMKGDGPPTKKAKTTKAGRATPKPRGGKNMGKPKDIDTPPSSPPSLDNDFADAEDDGIDKTKLDAFDSDTSVNAFIKQEMNWV